MEKLSKQYSAEELLEVVNRNRFEEGFPNEKPYSLDKLKAECSKDRYSASPVGSRLRKYREQAGLTQQEAAKALGTSNQSVCNWEKGYNDISLRNAYRLMRLYRLCSTEFVPDVHWLVSTPMDFKED